MYNEIFHRVTEKEDKGGGGGGGEYPNNPHPDLLQAQSALTLLLTKLVLSYLAPTPDRNHP